MAGASPYVSPGRGRALGTLPLGRLAGVDIVADWSVWIIVLLVGANLGLELLPRWHPHWAPALTWATTGCAAALFLASILVHELSHAIVGKRMGIGVSHITLFVFGGMAHTESEAPSPGAELWMSAAGPLMSLLIGLAATMGGMALAGVPLDSPARIALAIPEAGPLATLLLWVGPINLILGLFNLVPGFPLDGGRVLRAALWHATDDLKKATRWATSGGIAFSAFLMSLGVVSLLYGRWAEGVWLVVIGWFVYGAARSSYRQTIMHEALRSTRVDDVMLRGVDYVSPHVTVAQLAAFHGPRRSEQPCFPVVDEGGMLQGIVCPLEAEAVPEEQRDAVRVTEIMTPIARLDTMYGGAPATEALRLLSAAPHLPVVDGRGALLGLVRQQDITRWLTVHDVDALA